MRKLFTFLPAIMLCMLVSTASLYAQDPSVDRWVDSGGNTLISPFSGTVGISTSFPLAGTKLDVRQGNIFQSPLSSSSTTSFPRQFIGIGESFGQCDIYGVRVQKPKGLTFVGDPNPDVFVNMGAKTIRSSGTFSFNIVTPVISYYPFLAMEYDADPDGCPVRIATWSSNTATYQLDVAGDVRVVTLTQTSDERLKKDFREVTNARDKIDAMHPVSYAWNSGVAQAKNLKDQRNIGFKAQELRTILPEAVSEGEDGYLGINYSAVIPVLVAALQEQNQEIASLREELTTMRNNAPAQGLNNVPERIELFQNEPNPFNRETNIRLNLPQDVENAVLYVYDMNGRQIKELSLEERGAVSARISAGELEAGMYIYALVADGKAIDSKRMILTR
ncbi:tail fiber domain-containing protein [Roseivirga sp. BDSF3-8]|uniref:tail fiber domain-containing protein n=1 Tax=Roseivirga sp. BDSF3-8 TaxID=3241598 RepID=UPI003531B441